MHRAHESGTPARMTYIAQCDENTGAFRPVQCGAGNSCWCVDERTGQELPESRTRNGTKPNCNGEGDNILWIITYIWIIIVKIKEVYSFHKIGRFCLCDHAYAALFYL